MDHQIHPINGQKDPYLLLVTAKTDPFTGQVRKKLYYMENLESASENISMLEYEEREKENTFVRRCM